MPSIWRYDAEGRVVLAAGPSAVTGYDDAYADLLHMVSGNYQHLSDSEGLVTTYAYAGSTTATGTTAGDVAGYLTQMDIRQGETGTASPQEAWTYYQRTAGGATVSPVATDTVFRNDDGTGGQTTSYAYTWFSGTTLQESVTVTLPTVTTGQNGPGTPDTATVVYDAFGRAVWARDGDGFIHYTEYDPVTGAATKQIVDVDTTRTTTFSNLPSGWATPIGGGLHLTTLAVVDALGRTTEATDADGRVSWMVYKDAAHEVRVYAGWDSATGTATGPTTVIREDQARGYLETLTMTAAPSVTGGAPDGTEAVGGLQSLTRTYVNSAGQAVAQDAFFDLSGLAYSTSTGLGTQGTNYYRTQQAFDNQGLVNRTISATGTITRTVHDGLGRTVSVWVGANDAPVSGFWSPANAAGMVKVADYEYDDGGVGDGNLTKVTVYPGGGAPARVTRYFHDWRNRLVATKEGVEATEDTSVNRPITYYNYDNLGEVTKVRTYDGDGVSVVTTNGVPVAPSSALLRSQADYAYDEQGRLYHAAVYGVDPSTGSVSSSALTTDVWYDHRGNVVKTAAPGGLVQKAQHDGAGRTTVMYTTDGGGDTTWADALSVTGDAVLEQVEYGYDGAGNVLLATARQRFHDETATGALGDASTGPLARVSHVGAWYDAAGRLTASADVGTDGGSAWTRPSSVPARSDTVLVTSFAYGADGMVETTTDPKGIVSKAYHDALGRTTKTVANYVTGTPGSGTDVTTEYSYDGSNHVLTVTAVQPAGTPSQTTQFVYGVTTAGGSGVSSNDVLAATRHPDPTTGAASGSEQETLTVNALGQVTSATDRNGNVHSYAYDVLGRLVSDAVTTLGSGVDGAVRRVEYAYDALGHVSLVTSYDAATGGSIVNQILREFNGLGQLVTEWQEHGGAVDTSISPKVQYAYSEMASGANHSRLVSMTYPDGYVLDYDYATGLDDRISRLSSLSDGTGVLESYDYLGLGTVARRAHPQPNVDLTYIKRTGESDGDAGDKYVGLDRFGRVADQRWADAATGTATDRFGYGYDRDSQRTYRENLVDAVFSELYANDGLGQLTGFQRGTLDLTKTAISGTASRSQDWTLDALGNWTSLDTDGSTQTRTANAQNEYTAVGGATPAYDANGNMTTDETGRQLAYDAWNRLVTVKDSGGATLVAYAYDGLGRRITETKDGTTTDLAYSADWQVLQESVGGVATARYVWSPVYVDALVLRDRDTDADGMLDERLWVQQDANWNVTALVDGTGAVVERFVYDPYGSATALVADWTARGSSDYNWVYLHQGGRYDSASGLYSFRNRDYSPTLGRWTKPDPLGFAAGDNNWRRAYGNGPIDAIDPSGLEKRNAIGSGSAKAKLEGQVIPVIDLRPENHRTYKKQVVPVVVLYDRANKLGYFNADGSSFERYSRKYPRIVLDTGHFKHTVAELEKVAKKYGPICEVRIYAHGSKDGNQDLGGGQWLSRYVDSDPMLVKRLGKCIAPGGSLILYGCTAGLTTGLEPTEVPWQQNMADMMPHTLSVLATTKMVWWWPILRGRPSIEFDARWMPTRPRK